MNNNGWPLSRKKTVRLLVALTILAWATQTLMSQWARGGEEKFVPGTEVRSATIELRRDATVVGEEVRLRQVARWSSQDDAMLAPLGDMVLARINGGTPFRGVSIDEIKDTLHAAGVNVSTLNFRGATLCTVNRSDGAYDGRVALQQWTEARNPQPEPSTQPAGAVALPTPAPSPSADDKPVRTLREILTADLATRLSLDANALQVSFKSQDEGVLNLSEPMCRFEVEPQRLRNLGDVTWLVLIVAGEHVQKASVTANARAWQEQLVVSKPLGFKQVIREEDVIKRRTLVDRLSEDPLLAPDEAIGQQAARELKPGTVLTARMVDSVQLCKAGQYITITLTQGTVNIKSVARALEAGSYGQTIRVKNESTKEVFQVILTGPQQATMNLASIPQRNLDLASTGN